MKIVINRQLGWELADHLGRRLDSKERAAVFADLGSGDDQAALHRLICIVAENSYPLPARMSKELDDWVCAHNAQDSYGALLARIGDSHELCH